MDFNVLLISLVCFNSVLASSVRQVPISASLSKVWGPGLEPHKITMPARYFFIQAITTENTTLTIGEDDVFEVTLNGVSKTQSTKACRIWTNYLNRKDGSSIVRYKVYEPCTSLHIVIKHKNEHVANSPYVIPETVFPDECDCPTSTLTEFLEHWQCGPSPAQITTDLSLFNEVNWSKIREKVIDKYNQPHSISLCHYVIKTNLVYRKCYGRYVGFKMFMDSVLLSLSRKLKLPDLEFFVNLGDWPLVPKNSDLFPIFSWCGSTETRDIIMPTYDITESSLESMGRVMLDMLSVQGNVKDAWPNRLEKVFWRGRDSSQHRLDLVDISRAYPHLFNVSLTNFFFFRDKESLYGPKTDHVSFFSFFDYKYQLNLDGTVAAYRFPYLLAGGSLVMKQESQYYEHFYNDLLPNTHFVPVKRDLSDLVEKINWAQLHDAKAHTIARNGQEFANENLLPQHIFCYYTHLLAEFSKRITNKIGVLDGMEKVQQVKQPQHCNCNGFVKDEL